MSGRDGKGSALWEYRGLGVPEENTVGGQEGEGRDQQLLAALGASARLRWGNWGAGPVTHGWLSEFDLKTRESLIVICLVIVLLANSWKVETKIDEPIPAENNYRSFYPEINNK